MKVITEEYRKLQQELHQNPNYGVASLQFAPIVADIIKDLNVESLSDYGAGKKNLLKGQELAIEGRLVNNYYTDKQDIKRTVTEIVLNEILLLGKQKSTKETE